MGSPDTTITTREAAAFEVAQVNWKAVAEITGLDPNAVAAGWAPELDPEEIATLTRPSTTATE